LLSSFNEWIEGREVTNVEGSLFLKLLSSFSERIGGRDVTHWGGNLELEFDFFFQ
jgi:hypothetical protein